MRSSLRRLEQTAASRPKTEAERRRGEVERRRSVLVEFVQAIEASGPLSADLEREAFSVLHAYAEALLVDGFLNCDERGEGWQCHPLATFGAHLLLPGAVLPTPFPVELIEALCHPDALPISQHGCLSCEVMLPERIVPGGHRFYGLREFILPTCPACGSGDLGFVVRSGTGLRVHRVEGVAA